MLEAVNGPGKLHCVSGRANRGQERCGKNRIFKKQAEKNNDRLRLGIQAQALAGNFLFVTFWQTVWANIWNAVLAGSWPYPVGIPLGLKGAGAGGAAVALA
ncbi:MAG: hypothetical protein H7273_05710 [Polaromonas sp.]|nr:hypothetical protein [Polaromonas sp.]